MIPVAYAFTAGDPIEFSIENCKSWAVIEVVPLTPLDNNTVEYWIEGCDHLEDEFWMCYCTSSSAKAILHTSAKTVNTYEMTISYEYETPQQIDTGSRGGGGGGRSYIYIPNATNITKIVEQEVIINEPCPDGEVCVEVSEDEGMVIPDFDVELPEDKPQKEEAKRLKQDTPRFWTGLIIIFIIIGVGAYMYFYYQYLKHNEGGEKDE